MVNFNGDKEIWEKLLAHINHDVVMVYYGDSAENPDNIAIECQDCFEVLIDIDNPANLEENAVTQCKKDGTHLKSVDRDGYCNSCGYQ